MADSKDSSQTPYSGIAVLLLIAAGLFVKHQWPFESSRPADAAIKAGQVSDIQDVDARLWEDPFASVARYDQERPAASRDDHDASQLRGKIAERKPAVFGAMVYGGPYADDIEIRRRTRYAVLAGLDASGYTPDSTDKVGFFRPGKRTYPEIVPFEFFQGKKPEDWILLLWLAEERLSGDDPTSRLASMLKDELGIAAGKEVRMIGPATSTTLKLLIKAAMSKCEDGKRPPKDWAIDSGGLSFFYYAHGATAIAEDLLPDGPCSTALKKAARANAENSKRHTEDVLWELFRGKQVSMLRTMNNDDEVLTSIVQELTLRGVRPGGPRFGKPDHIVLVSEWDTDYGRNLPKRFVHAACTLAGGAPDSDEMKKCLGPEESSPPWVTQLSYLRGLDGGVASKRPPTEREGASDKSDKDKNGKAIELLERADGNSQYDYLRRLGNVVHERTLGRGGEKHVTAVGVLGSDVYDKLLVLQALRPIFPEAIFFTTDLDARLAQPNQYVWTRNLLVGSGHGLELKQGAQGRVPPFRDAYQTAAFLAVRLALDKQMSAEEKRNRLDNWLAFPRVYEIGRTQAFALQPWKEAKASAPSDECKSLKTCEDIRPSLPFFGPDSGTFVRAVLWVVALALSLALLSILFWQVRKAVMECWGRLRKGPRTRFTFGAGFVLVVVVVAAVSVDPQGEPFTWLEGISIWPTELIRLLALLLSVCFTAGALRPVALEANALDGKFFPSRDGKGDRHESFRISKWYSQYEDDGKRYEAQDLWDEFRALEKPRERALRVVIPIVLYMVALTCLLFALGGPPAVPYRGSLAFWVDKLVLVTGSLAFLVLLFVVLDVTRLGWALVRNLSTKRSNYPDKTVGDLRTELNVDAQSPKEPLCDLLDIRLISAYTERVNSFFYFPFLVLALMVIARSPLFDNWSLPPGLAVFFLLTFLIAVGYPVVLRRAAEHARKIAAERVGKYLVKERSKAAANKAYVAQLEAMLEEINGARRGAFLPFLQQPAVKAFLYPAGGFGGFQVLEYFLTKV